MYVTDSSLQHAMSCAVYNALRGLRTFGEQADLNAKTSDAFDEVHGAVPMLN